MKGNAIHQGGIASKSNYSPVRQYNRSRPDKCRIDFFILANASGEHNVNYHIDVYQGKNVQNISTDKELWNFQSMQSDVVWI